MTAPSIHRWPRGWLVGGAALLWLLAANVFGWWVVLGADLDTEALDRTGVLEADGFTYLGAEFTADSFVLYLTAIVVSTLILTRDRTNRFGWVFIATWGLLPTILPVLGGLLGLSAGAVLPTSWAPALALLVKAGGIALLTGIPLSLALFPTGGFHSTGWRRVFVGYFALWCVVTLSILLRPGAISIIGETLALENPIGVDWFEWVSDEAVLLLSLALGVLSVASQVARYVAAGSEVRHQLKWFVTSVVFIIVGSTATFPIDAWWSGWIQTLGGTLVIVSIGVAILRYRLYEIDLIINRALVYGSLAVFIGVVYVAVVVGIGSLIGSGDEPNAVLSVGATALVAVGFQPVRRRLERVANRLVFGRKATPYEVLSEFSRRVAATSDVLLDEAARSLAEGTRAERVVVSIMIDGEPAEAAAWPREAAASAASESVSFQITDGDSALGSLDVYLPAGQHLQDDDRRLAEQLSSGMGLALRNQLLTERLEARVEELRESRRRLVAVQDETRRRLERDLHDGAQQQLVALKVKLGLGRAIAEKDGATQTAQLLERLSGEADQAVDAMREFARGVYPPLLEAEGLASAISAQARRAPIPVTVDADGIGRYPREIESTVYFCVLEALRNAIQHAGASRVNVNLIHAHGSLEFQVSDDGAGFEANSTHGVGLTAMADRLDALTGELAIHTEPHNGTTLTGTVPLPAEVPA
jgi:signal transduction histidine kinase